MFQVLSKQNCKRFELHKARKYNCHLHCILFLKCNTIGYECKFFEGKTSEFPVELYKEG